MSDRDYIQIDALTCRKRFHCRVESDQPKQEKVEFRCPECHALLWEGQDTYPLRYLRNENLVNEENLSTHQSRRCNMFDKPIQN